MNVFETDVVVEALAKYLKSSEFRLRWFRETVTLALITLPSAWYAHHHALLHDWGWASFWFVISLGGIALYVRQTEITHKKGVVFTRALTNLLNDDKAYYKKAVIEYKELLSDCLREIGTDRITEEGKKTLRKHGIDV